MTPEYVIAAVLPAAYQLLPGKMRSHDADVMLVAIALQESRLEYRRQIRGPARGFWQFESGGGVRGVLRHEQTKDHASRVLGMLSYSHAQDTVHEALADNDILAACFARLLLWSDARPLPTECNQAWGYYLQNWRPGKPHRSTWDHFWQKANEVTA